jgi:hypothetical protein
MIIPTRRSELVPCGTIAIVCLHMLWSMCFQVHAYAPVLVVPPKKLASLPSLGGYRYGNRHLTMYMRDDVDDDDDEEDDDEPPEVDVSNFVAPKASYGLNRGRSSPSQRKAMGTSGSSTARIHICSS